MYIGLNPSIVFATPHLRFLCKLSAGKSMLVTIKSMNAEKKDDSVRMLKSGEKRLKNS